MTRLKQTLAERRLAALEAAAILRSRGEEGRAQEVEESVGPDVGDV